MFDNDLKKGQEYERRFAQYLADEKGFTRFIYNNDDEFDILAIKDSPDGRAVYRFEIKTDFYADTGNLAIELMCLKRGKLTGLWATKAKYFVYIFQHGKTYVFDTKELRKFIAENDVRVTRGGDNKYALLALLPKEDADKIAKQVI